MASSHLQNQNTGNLQIDNLYCSELFAIPNPFELSINEKKDWLSKVRNLEGKANSTRSQLKNLVAKNQLIKEEIEKMREYCFNIRKRQNSNDIDVE